MRNLFKRILKVEVEPIEPTTLYYRGIQRQLSVEKRRPKSKRNQDRIEFLQQEKSRARKGITL
jgi:hypothetical protein